MKIALFVPSWPPGRVSNGIVTYASYLVPALRRLGHKVFVLAAHNMDDQNDPYTIDLEKYEPSPTLWGRALTKVAPGRCGFQFAIVPNRLGGKRVG